MAIKKPKSFIKKAHRSKKRKITKKKSKKKLKKIQPRHVGGAGFKNLPDEVISHVYGLCGLKDIERLSEVSPEVRSIFESSSSLQELRARLADLAAKEEEERVRSAQLYKCKMPKIGRENP